MTASEYQSAKRIFGDVLNWKSSLFMIIAAFIVAWLPDGVAGLVTELLKNKDRNFLLPIIQLSISLLFIWLTIYSFKKTLENLETTVEAKTVLHNPKKNLVLFLSYLRQNQLEEANNIHGLLEIPKEHSWYMPLIAIKAHKLKIENLYIIHSEQSIDQVDTFINLVKNSYPSLNIYMGEAINFESVEPVLQRVETLYQEIKSNGHQENEIMLDVTGGQKVTSIVGAMFALGYNRKFQYVSTGNQEVLVYDLNYNWK